MHDHHITPRVNPYAVEGSTALEAMRSARTLTQRLRALYEGTFLDARLPKFREAMNPADCLEELAVARALLEDFLVNYEQQNQWAEMWAKAKATKDLPPPPVRWLYPDDALPILEQISKLASRLQIAKGLDVMPRREVRWVVMRMGQAVEGSIQDANPQVPGWKTKLLEEIRDAWMKIWV